MTILDARRLDTDDAIDCDVCIVGAGPAGITLAMELATSPLRVCLLESGGLNYDSRNQVLLEGEMAGAPYPEIRDTRLAALGGASAVWAGWCRPLDPIDFEPRDGLPDSGWPFPQEELLPYYARAHQLCGLEPYDYDVDAWRVRTGGEPLPFAGGNFETRLFHVRPLHFGLHYRDALHRAANVRTLLHASALRLDLVPGSERIDRIQAGTLNGKRFDVTATRFVLAAGGIENPRLMLLSGESAERSVGNTYGIVGRYFMEHGFINAGAYVASDSALPLSFYFPSDDVGGGRPWKVRSALGLTEQALRNGRLLNGALFFHPPYESHAAFDTPAVHALLEIGSQLKRRAVPGNYGSRLARALSSPGNVITAIARRMFAGRVRPGRWRTRAIFECAPNRTNRVALAAAARDPFGRPVARLEWSPAEQDIQSVMKAHKLFDSTLRQAGLGHFEARLPNDPALWRTAVEGGKHHMGTTRMHRDRRVGVVDANGKVHGVTNLYVAGSSVFPTGGYANPTLTLVALAVRLGRHLAGAVPSASVNT